MFAGEGLLARSPGLRSAVSGVLGCQEVFCCVAEEGPGCCGVSRVQELGELVGLVGPLVVEVLVRDVLVHFKWA